jgi:uncharacterized protein DUF6114/zinc ribbon protein
LVLAVIGGVIILATGGFEAWIGSQLSGISFGFYGGTLVLTGIIGVIVGILIVIFGALAFVQPQHHVVYGVLIIVFSVVSLVTFFGGFLVGFILALIGGILAVVHRSTPAFVGFQYAAPPPIQRVCPKCGHVVDPSVRFCPHCGNPLG